MTLTRMEIGRCKYCGQEKAVEAESRYDADEDATLTCTCAGAERHRKFERAQDALATLAMNLRDDEREAAAVCLKMAEQLDKLEKVLP